MTAAIVAGAGMCAAAAAFPAAAASAPGAAPAPPPAVRVETGTLDGAAFRIDMPRQWNGVLLVYYHGYSQRPVGYDGTRPDPIGSSFAAAGFAVAQSGYSATGWAEEEAMAETEALRRHAIARFGQPRETYVLGHSLGGQLTVATIERQPNRYDGALVLCGSLQGATRSMTRASALLAAFHFYFPGVLPGPRDVGPEVALDAELARKVAAALASNPTGRSELLAIGRLKSDQDLADGIVFDAYLLRDLQQKIGAAILDNHNWIYAGGPDDNALNDGVVRYTASAAALAYLQTWYTPGGLLLQPVLAVHTTYDPIVPAETLAAFADAVQRAGSGDRFVQQYVPHDGHCNISGAETAAALQELIAWKRTGIKPPSGRVPVAAQ